MLEEVFTVEEIIKTLSKLEENIDSLNEKIAEIKKKIDAKFGVIEYVVSSVLK